MNKNKKKSCRQISKKQLWQRLLIAALFLAIIIKAGWETYVTMKLESEGVITNAIVTKKKRNFNHGEKVYYRFTINNRQYSGVSHEFTDYHHCSVGGTITIVYLPTNPNINDSKYRID